jgi:hypothetical protein
MRVTIPATALAQAIRSPARQFRLSQLIRQASTDLVALDGPDATAAGLLLAASRTGDIVDAHVVVCARRAERSIAQTGVDNRSVWEFPSAGQEIPIQFAENIARRFCRCRRA